MASRSMTVQIHRLRSSVQRLKEIGNRTGGWPALPVRAWLAGLIADAFACGHHRRAGSSINDVLVAAVTAALRRFTEEAKQPIDLLNAVVWVTMQPLSILFKRAAEVPIAWGNANLGCVYLRLPAKEAGRQASGTCNYQQLLQRVSGLSTVRRSCLTLRHTPSRR